MTTDKHGREGVQGEMTRDASRVTKHFENFSAGPLSVSPVVTVREMPLSSCRGHRGGKLAQVPQPAGPSPWCGPVGPRESGRRHSL